MVRLLLVLGLVLAPLAPIPARLASDLDRDGIVGFSDFLAFARDFGRRDPADPSLEGLWTLQGARNGYIDLPQARGLAVFSGTQCAFDWGFLGASSLSCGAFLAAQGRIRFDAQDGTHWDLPYALSGDTLTVSWPSREDPPIVTTWTRIVAPNPRD